MDGLSVVFFVSGATSLVYQSVWLRQLHLLVGTSPMAVATVLAAFMAGLGLGGAWMGPRAARLRDPLRTYAILEACIGAMAWLLPRWVEALGPATLVSSGLDGDPTNDAVRVALVAGAVLVVPTACMGATLPVLAAWVARDPARAGADVGRLYAWNTAGAMAGTWAVGFVLLPTFGVATTTGLAATGNLLLAAWIAARASAVPGGVAGGGLSPPPQTQPEAPSWWDLGVVAAVAGFASLALEVAWTRLMGLILGASTYAFTVMLLAFLGGIAGGGALGARWCARHAAGGPAAARRALPWTLLAVATATWLGAWSWGALPVVFARLWFGLGGDTWLLWPSRLVLAAAVMVPPAIGMGAAFPLLVQAAGDARVSRATGRIYAANTAGSVVGALMAGFLLLPQAGLVGTVRWACAAYVAAAGFLALRAVWTRSGDAVRVPRVRRRGVGWAVVAAAVAVGAVSPPWNPMLMTSGMYKYVQNLDSPTYAEIRARMLDRYELLYYAEGPATVMTVARNRETGNLWLANNGKIDASSTGDMPTQVLVAHLPFLFPLRDGGRALLVGLASGITLGAMTTHATLGRIDVAELEPRMPEAAAFFRPWNRDSLRDPRVRLYANDGRNHLLRAPPGTYDLVVSEPSNPWLTGVSNLFTREFFAMGKARLAPGGVWSQWLQLYGMDARDVRAIVRTFSDVYPHVRVFSTIHDADLVLLGSDSPLVMDLDRATEVVAGDPDRLAELAGIGVTSGHHLIAHALLDDAGARSFASTAPLNTDDNLLVEFSAPRNLYRETSTENFLALRPLATVPVDAEPDAAGLVALGEVYLGRDEPVRALKAARAAEAREPGRADVVALFDAARAALDVAPVAR
jgi:spermidine synthase